MKPYEGQYEICGLTKALCLASCPQFCKESFSSRCFILFRQRYDDTTSDVFWKGIISLRPRSGEYLMVLWSVYRWQSSGPYFQWRTMLRVILYPRSRVSAFLHIDLRLIDFSLVLSLALSPTVSDESSDGPTSIEVMQQSSSEEYCGNEDWSICRVGYLRTKIVENPESGHAGSVTGVGWELRVKDKTELECVFSSSAFYVGVLPQMLEIISAAFFHKPFSAVSIPYLKVVDVFSHSRTLKKLFKKTDVPLEVRFSYTERIKEIKFVIVLQEWAGKLTLLSSNLQGWPHFLYCNAVTSSQGTSLSQGSNWFDAAVVASVMSFCL